MSRYDEHIEHPLWGVPDELLDVAHLMVPEEALVDPELVEPIADAVVAAVAEWLGPSTFLAACSVRKVELARERLREIK